VISNTAQWPRGKKDKIDKQWSAIQHNGQRKKRTQETNSDQQYSTMTIGKPLCCIADHCLSILSLFSHGHCAVLLITICLLCPFFPLPIVLYCWSLFVYCVLFFLWSLCCIADHCLSILSFFSFGHCAVLLITICLFCLFFPLVIVLYCWSLFVYFVFFSLWPLCCIGKKRQIDK
jgi:hypothetical protein